MIAMLARQLSEPGTDSNHRHIQIIGRLVRRPVATLLKQPDYEPLEAANLIPPHRVALAADHMHHTSQSD